MQLVKSIWNFQVGKLGDVISLCFIIWCIAERPWQGLAFAAVQGGFQGTLNYLLTGFPVIWN